MLLNAAMSYGTFWVLNHWIDSPPSEAGEHNDPLHLLVVSAGAGLGGTTLIRGRLATIRLPGGQELGIGPAIVIETLLAEVVRQLDRQLGVERCRTVHRLKNGIDFDRAKNRLPTDLFLTLHSVPAEEAARLFKRIDEIDRMDHLSSQAKSCELGYYLLDLVGKKLLIVNGQVVLDRPH